MTYLQAAVLGVIQGATEFIPVSSSGHLVIAPYFLGWKLAPQQAFVFDVLVQVATLSAVIVYFWPDLWAILTAFIQGLISRKPFADPQSRLGWLLLLATIPAGIAALLMKDILEQAFNSPKTAAFFLILTGLMLAGAERFRKQTISLPSLGWMDALWVGTFQVLALFPGISRSGSTITGGMLRGLNRSDAASFSFLMSVPVMLAAGVLGIYDLVQMDQGVSQIPVFLVGFLAAALVGYLAIRWLLRFLRNRSLLFFSAYCLVAGLLTLLTIYL
jgi:undecaprenyl-diphosphatase